ncbi:hypothetical protein GNF86_02055 [Clostridium perfringens]
MENRELIKMIKLIEKYKDEIIEYTLGDKKERFNELSSDMYVFEWDEFKHRIKWSIRFLKTAKLELTPELLTYLIINEWSRVWCDEKYLNIDKLRELSKTIIEEMI